MDTKSLIGIFHIYLDIRQFNLIFGRYERTSWIPVLVVCLVSTGLGANNMSNPPPSEPASAKAILTFASTIAGFTLTYAGLASDFTTYMDPNVSKFVIMLFSPFKQCFYLCNIAGQFSGIRMQHSL